MSDLSLIEWGSDTCLTMRDPVANLILLHCFTVHSPALQDACIPFRPLRHVAAEDTPWSDRDKQCACLLLDIDIYRLRSIVTTMVQEEHRSRHRTIALFDVDGTLSVARKVSTWQSAQAGIMPQLTP